MSLTCSSNRKNSLSLGDSSAVACSVSISTCSPCKIFGHAGSGKDSEWGTGQLAEGKLC